MLTRAQKEEQVAELRDRFDRAKSVVLADYRGLDVASVNALRRQLVTEGGGEFEYRVSKNTLLRRAVEGSDAEALVPHMSGPTAVAFSFGDPLRLVKVLVDYAKDHEVFEIRGGLLEGEAIDRAQIETLASLPSLDELRGTLAGLLQAPAQQLARLLQAPAGQLARVAEARRAKLEESGSAT